MQATVYLIILTFLASCGKSNSSSPKKTQSQEAEALYGKSLSEVLSLKYDEAKIKCSLRLQENEVVDLSQKPNEVFSWDLIDPLDVKKKSIVLGNLSGTITYKLSEVKIVDSVYYSTNDGREFQMMHSPVVKIASDSKLESRTDDSFEIIKQGYEMDMFENVGINHRTEETTVDDKHHLVDLRCELSTKIKQAYKDQFVRVK